MKDTIRLTESTLVGTQYYQAPEWLVENLSEGDALVLKREPDNKYDENAIQVFLLDKQVGHIKGTDAQLIAPFMDTGVEVIGELLNTFNNQLRIIYND